MCFLYREKYVGHLFSYSSTEVVRSVFLFRIFVHTLFSFFIGSLAFQSRSAFQLHDRFTSRFTSRFTIGSR